MSFPVFSGNRESGAHPANDDPFTRHDKYYFKDGNITFLVDGTLYCVHRYFFDRDSTYFATRLKQLGIREHETLSIIISLGEVECKDFEAFLSVLYPDDFEEHDLSFEQWKSVLHLSSRWGFTSLRKLALKSIKPPTPSDQLLLARAYSVDHWVLPALSALCERPVPLSLSEARQMSVEDIVLVTTVREDIRHHTLQVDSDEIPHCIEAAQTGMRAIKTGHGAFHLEGARRATPTSPSTSNGTERSARRSTAGLASNTGPEGENSDDAKTAVAVSPVDVPKRGAKRDDDMSERGVDLTVGSRSSEKSSRPTSAWGKILVVPSPTASHPSQAPVWGAASNPVESRGDLPLLGRANVNAKPPHYSGLFSARPKLVEGDLSDEDGDTGWSL